LKILLTAIALLLTVGQNANAQDYPVKPVRVIVPFPPAGPNDVAVRPLAPRLHELLGQPFVVDNRAGANGIIGSELVAKAPPDGYALLVISSSFAINASTYAKLPFDPLRDFAPVSPIATSDIIMVTNPTVPAKTIRDFVALAKSQPGKLNYASSGNGGSLHLGMELLKATARIDMVHVPYKGAALALSDLIGGHVDSMFISAAGAIGQIKAGKVRVLATASAHRAKTLPDTPTFVEAGYPDVIVESRYGLITTAGTPGATVERLNAAIAKAVATPVVREQYAASSLEPLWTTAQDYAAYLRAEVARWRTAVAAAKLPLQ
jgi:tripartite-type tricarboxylate transporter receptor subunit TctC